MTETISPVNVAEGSAAEHQSLADRLFSVFKGAEQYVVDHLPEHHLKDAVLADIRNGWDHAVAVIKGDLASHVPAIEQAAQSVVSDATTGLEQVAEDVTSSVAQTAETVAADVTNVTPSSDTAAPSEGSTGPSSESASSSDTSSSTQDSASASVVSEGSAPESDPETAVSDTPAAS